LSGSFEKNEAVNFYEKILFQKYVNYFIIGISETKKVKTPLEVLTLFM